MPPGAGGRSRRSLGSKARGTRLCRKLEAGRLRPVAPGRPRRPTVSARLFGNWIAYQVRGCSGRRYLRVCPAVLKMEAVRHRVCLGEHQRHHGRPSSRPFETPTCYSSTCPTQRNSCAPAVVTTSALSASFATSRSTPARTKPRRRARALRTAGPAPAAGQRADALGPDATSRWTARLRHGDDPGDDGEAHVPVIGFIAHVDTSPEMAGHDVKPIVHGSTTAATSSCPTTAAVLPSADNPGARRAHRSRHRHRSGLTLLGADDKAGVAEIVAAAEYLMGIPSPAWRLSASGSPGRGDRPRRKPFRRRTIRRRCAPTRWTAAARRARVGELLRRRDDGTFRVSTPIPGYAKGRMVNAIKSPPSSSSACRKTAVTRDDGRLRRLRPSVRRGCIGRSHVVKLLIRDFYERRARGEGSLPRAARREVVAPYEHASVEIRIAESYRNMREILEGYPDVVEYAREAIRRSGLDARRATHPRRHRWLAAVIHGTADAEHLRGRAQLPLAARVGVGAGHGQGGRNDRQRVQSVGGTVTLTIAGSYPQKSANGNPR